MRVLQSFSGWFAYQGEYTHGEYHQDQENAMGKRVYELREAVHVLADRKVYPDFMGVALGEIGAIDRIRNVEIPQHDKKQDDNGESRPAPNNRNTPLFLATRGVPVKQLKPSVHYQRRPMSEMQRDQHHDQKPRGTRPVRHEHREHQQRIPRPNRADGKIPRPDADAVVAREEYVRVAQPQRDGGMPPNRAFGERDRQEIQRHGHQQKRRNIAKVADEQGAIRQPQHSRGKIALQAENVSRVNVKRMARGVRRDSGNRQRMLVRLVPTHATNEYQYKREHNPKHAPPCEGAPMARIIYVNFHCGTGFVGLRMRSVQRRRMVLQFGRPLAWRALMRPK